MDILAFSSKFHKIEGKTLGEKQKNFNLLLQQIPKKCDLLSKTIVPTNDLEEIFKLKLLIQLQDFNELIEILKNENEILAAKLLKNKWFCQQLAEKVDEKFVADIFPSTSFVIRQRLIFKLAQFGNDLDRIFDAIFELYGITIAQNLLVACSGSKIENVLRNHKVSIPVNLLKILFKRHPTMLELYLKQQTIDGRKLSIFIANENLNYFIESNCFGNVGKRITRKIVHKYKDVIIENSKNFSCILHLRTLTKMMGEEDLKKFLYNCSPDTVDELKYRGHIGFRNLKEKLGRTYYTFLLDLMQNKYNKDLFKYPDLVDDDILESMNSDEREKWLEIKPKSDDFIAFMKIENSITLLKKRINLTSDIRDRGDLLRLLIKSCKINQDYDALYEVLTYFNGRHKNDDESILRDFLYELTPLLEKLQDRHWTEVRKILTSLDKFGENSYFNLNFDKKYLEFLFKNNSLTDENLLEFLKHKSFDIGNQKLRKLVLLKSVEVLNPIDDLHVIYAICDYNKQNLDPILLLQNTKVMNLLKHSFQLALEDDYNPKLHSLDKILENIICENQDSVFRREIVQQYFLLNFRFFNLDIDFWLLKHEPDTIELHFQTFLEHLFNRTNIKLLNFLKYNENSFKTRITNHALNLIKENNETAFVALAILDSELFLQNLNESSLSSSKFCLNSVVLSNLIKFCKGEFLRYALESIYYLFYHLPQNKLIPYLNELSTKSVSARKHSIFLTFNLFSISEKKTIFKKFETDSNESIQKHLITATFNNFKKNPSDQIWYFVQTIIKKLNENDVETCHLVTNLHKFPEKYQSKYLILVWDLLEQKELLLNYGGNLLSVTDEDTYKNLNTGFVLKVILKYFANDVQLQNVNDFIINSLVYSDEKDVILGAIFDHFIQIKNCNKRKYVSNFVNALTSTSCRDIILIFFENWQKLFGKTEAFREYLQMIFFQIYEDTLEEFGNKIIELYEDLISTYGIIIVDCFAKQLCYFLEFCYNPQRYKLLRLCQYFLKTDKTDLKILVLKLLPSQEPNEDEAIFNDLLSILKSASEESVKLLLHLYLREL